MKSKTFVAICYIPAFIYFLDNGTNTLITVSETTFSRVNTYNIRLTEDAYLLIFWIILPLFIFPFEDKFLRIFNKIKDKHKKWQNS